MTLRQKIYKILAGGSDYKNGLKPFRCKRLSSVTSARATDDWHSSERMKSTYRARDKRPTAARPNYPMPWQTIRSGSDVNAQIGLSGRKLLTQFHKTKHSGCSRPGRLWCRTTKRHPNAAATVAVRRFSYSGWVSST